jgi:hypothetical protein
MPIDSSELCARSRDKLDLLWNKVQVEVGSVDHSTSIDNEIIEAIRRIINCSIKSYRYVPLTQLLAKSVDRTLDCRSIQKEYGGKGAFDARTLAHSVIVEFDRANDNVLGGSPEPYVNNPLRIAGILPRFRSAQKNKSGFDDLCTLLEYAERNPLKIESLILVTLDTIWDRLQDVVFTYPVPGRISIDDCLSLIQGFLMERTGGVRLEAMSVALFETIGSVLKLFSKVRSSQVNASDVSTGIAADIECLDNEGNVALAVEAKDRTLVLRHISDKMPAIRAKGIGELLFLIQGGIVEEDQLYVADVIEREFVSGQNIYVLELSEFLKTCLVLFGEDGRRQLLAAVGESLDKRKVDLRHRQAWRDSLASI